MDLVYACPQCGEEQRETGVESGAVIDCGRCGFVGILPLDWRQDERVERCPICGTDELYRQKDFHQRLAIGILLLGGVLAVITKFLSVLAAALLDLILYLTSPEALVCYACRARVKGHSPRQRHGRYDPRIDEQVRRRTRLKNAQNTHPDP